MLCDVVCVLVCDMMCGLLLCVGWCVVARGVVCCCIMIWCVLLLCDLV